MENFAKSRKSSEQAYSTEGLLRKIAHRIWDRT
jgi:hypothetical protein